MEKEEGCPLLHAHRERSEQRESSAAEEGRWSANGCSGEANGCSGDAERAAHPPGGKLSDKGDAVGLSTRGGRRHQWGHMHTSDEVGWASMQR